MVNSYKNILLAGRVWKFSGKWTCLLETLFHFMVFGVLVLFVINNVIILSLIKREVLVAH